MKKIILSISILFTLFSCQQLDNGTETSSLLSPEEKAMVKAAGFNSNWAEKTIDGKYLIENDILLSAEELADLSLEQKTNHLITAAEEHYRTYNIVKVPAGGVRTITVSISNTFPSYYSTGLNNAIAAYNNLNLGIQFQRVSARGEIDIKGSNLGTTSTGGCILGQAAGFPSKNGNPSRGFTLSTSTCATNYISTATRAEEVIAHEIGHCIGFRHTDYATRASCGGNSPEPIDPYGAVHIPGTPTSVSGSNNSWMMACTNGSAGFTAEDNTALSTVYPR